MASGRSIFAVLLVLMATMARGEPPELFTHTVPLPAPSPPAEYLQLFNIGLNHEAVHQPAQRIVLDLPHREPEIVELVAFSPRAGFIQVPDPDDPTGFGIITIPDPNAKPGDFEWHWYGRSPNFTVALNVYKGILAGRISGPGYYRYALFPAAGGITRLGIVNPAWWRSHPEGDGLGIAPASLRNFAALPGASATASVGEAPPVPTRGGWDATCSGPPPSGQHVIDVLVLYTAGVLNAYGQSHDNVVSVVQLALQDANISLRNSGIHSVRFSLRGPEFLPNPGGGIGYDQMEIIPAIHLLGGTEELSDFPYIGFPGNSYVSARRDAMWADVVALARRDPSQNTCGYSWIPRTVLAGGYPSEPGPDWQKFGYLVFDPVCNADRLNLAHELGHQLGMEHDPRNSEVPGLASVWPACQWAYSHRRGGEVPARFRFRTIGADWYSGPGSGSSYICGPGFGDPAFCPLIDAFSTPYLEWAGLAENGGGPPYGLQPVGTVAGAPPIGVAVQTSQQLRADVADTMLRLAPITAAFRARPEQIFANGFQ